MATLDLLFLSSCGVLDVLSVIDRYAKRSPQRRHHSAARASLHKKNGGVGKKRQRLKLLSPPKCVGA